jgi:hypothetical protein
MKNILTWGCILLFLSCMKSNHKTDEISKVELARSGAWSDYGSAISIDSSLNYKYCDDNFKGANFVGKIDKRFWDTLTTRLEADNFTTIDSTTDMNTFDASYFELIIHWNNKRKRIIRVGNGREPIVKLCSWLDSSYKKVHLSRINQPIKFESEFQKKRRPPFHDTSTSAQEK